MFFTMSLIKLSKQVAGIRLIRAVLVNMSIILSSVKKSLQPHNDKELHGSWGAL